ncbi:MAG: uroporphyrinogen-III synthase [Bacteroidota bacterium]
MNLLKVFISRDLKKDSPFQQILTQANFLVYGKNLLQFHPVKFSLPATFDWLFFYSKNGVQFFLQSLPDRALIDTKKIATIGKGTADFAEELGLSVNFVGTGQPITTAKNFEKVASHQKVLFPRAKYSRQSIQKLLLTSSIECLDLVIYENIPKDHFSVPNCDILVFTSPLNAISYFQQYTYKNSQHLVAIGKTTENALIQLGHKNVLTATQPTEKALAELVLSLDR